MQQINQKTKNKSIRQSIVKVVELLFPAGHHAATFCYKTNITNYAVVLQYIRIFMSVKSDLNIIRFGSNKVDFSIF